MKARLASLPFAAILAVSTAWAGDREIVGLAEVIDGNTMIVAGQRLRLYGSDAPDLGQTCSYDQRPFPCGDVARTALMDLVAGGEVRCRPHGPDAAGSRSATCTVQEADVAANMVHTGWAVANRDEMPDYARLEARAHNAKRGLWRGAFAMPADWRRDNAKP